MQNTKVLSSKFILAAFFQILHYIITYCMGCIKSLFYYSSLINNVRFLVFLEYKINVICFIIVDFFHLFLLSLFAITKNFYVLIFLLTLGYQELFLAFRSKQHRLDSAEKREPAATLVWQGPIMYNIIV